ncbi:uncharacterized protein SCHCODRAFT_02631487 [Schizophyllum commune H4-8]|uniref:uncharacterized protein n=1 Tax=Schizophyllum commune (strain H4-8 / FGSC 9210) TaxID=578458 RepID=UPI00215E85D0|nr:uncharacterized protein SCHCODRAFT_02631487 [Schizophyllum commune H4-8]KAI5890318.1 hypothetical protein SCHCODRAFT_02631487 [Schizophyllum commune H4-8]
MGSWDIVSTLLYSSLSSSIPFPRQSAPQADPSNPSPMTEVAWEDHEVRRMRCTPTSSSSYPLKDPYSDSGARALFHDSRILTRIPCITKWFRPSEVCQLPFGKEYDRSMRPRAQRRFEMHNHLPRKNKQIL